MDKKSMDKSSLVKKKYIPNARLREERERHNWTYKDVAHQINLPDARTVGRWERGVSFPSAYYRRKLCAIFEMSAEELDLIRQTSLGGEDGGDGTGQRGGCSSLPVAFTSFIGREQSIIEVKEKLMRPDVRLLTLLGVGGIGKTRLAIEVASQVKDIFTHGVCFVSLATIHHPSLVVPIIVEALQIQGSMRIPQDRQIKMFLSNKHMMLLLDNFEHVVAAAPFLEELLRACSQVKVIVTSCQRLQLQAEHEFSVPALTFPLGTVPFEVSELMRYSAIALFVQRAQSYVPDFQLTELNVSAVAQLCRRLDGLPLAIELAAAHIKMLTPRSLLDRLTYDMSILRSCMRDIPERQRTLYQAIGWSYHLLNEQEKWLFRHLSVFSGGVTLETIEEFFQARCCPAMLDGQNSPSLMEVTASLMARCFLQRCDLKEAEPRFVMLETIRFYGQECLRANGEWMERCRAYALYYLRLVERAYPHLKGAEQMLWLERLEREHKNLQAALGWLIERKEIGCALRFCEAYGKFCGLVGYWHEEHHWLQAVLTLPASSEHEAVLARILRRAGHFAYRKRELTRAQILLERSTLFARKYHHTSDLVGALSTLGWVCYRQNKICQANQCLQEGVEVAYQAGDEWALANVLESQGRLIYVQGEVERAYRLVEESLRLARKLGDKEVLTRVMTTLVDMEIARGQRVRAAMLAQESMKLALQLGTKPLVALALDALGDVAMFQGRYDEARKYIEERMEEAKALGDTATVASRQLKLADIAWALGIPEQTMCSIEDALSIFREQNDVSHIIDALRVLGHLKRLTGNVAQARVHYKEAMQFYTEFGDKRKIGKCLIGMAHIFLQEGQYQRVVSLCGSIEAIMRPVIDLIPAQYEEYEQILAQARAQLSEEDFSGQWFVGKSMLLEELIAGM
jgi:predicted ATPase/DNA-binding XRE family transcriptional regulator